VDALQDDSPLMKEVAERVNPHFSRSDTRLAINVSAAIVGPLAVMRDLFPGSTKASEMFTWLASTFLQQVNECQAQEGVQAQQLYGCLSAACNTPVVGGGGAALLYAAQARRTFIHLNGAGNGSSQEVIALDYPRLAKLLAQAGKPGHALTVSEVKDLLRKRPNLGKWQHSLELPVMETTHNWLRQAAASGQGYAKVKCHPMVLALSALPEELQALVRAAVPADVRASCQKPLQNEPQGPPIPVSPLQQQDLPRPTSTASVRVRAFQGTVHCDTRFPF
jgi:hypothetical protein